MVDNQTLELLRRSDELLDLCKQAHESADSLKKRLHELHAENRGVIERAIQILSDSEKLCYSKLNNVLGAQASPPARLKSDSL